jgi:hypothetical protein
MIFPLKIMGKAARNRSASAHCRKAQPGLSQSEALLMGEREENVPFSIHIRANDSIDVPLERFLASLRFEQRGKLDQLGTKIGSFE